jgi:hypothetical protein
MPLQLSNRNFMTKAATRFLETVSPCWSPERWQRAISWGLESDADTLIDLCEDTDDVGHVFAEVMEAVRAKVQAAGGKVPNQDIWTDINQEELK